MTTESWRWTLCNSCHYLAQLDVARAVDDLDSLRLAPFVTALPAVNAVAKRSPGFIWRLKAKGDDALAIKVTDDARFHQRRAVALRQARL